MKFTFSKFYFILGIIIPSFLFSACSDKEEVIHISGTPKVWLGVHVKNIPERRLNNLKLDYGLEVIKVYKDSPAEKAGLEVGDILLEIDGSDLKDVGDLSDIIEDMDIDEKTDITYLRNGEELKTEATMSKRNRQIMVWNNRHKDLKHFITHENRSWLGVSTSKLTDQLRQYFNVPEYLGVLVKEVIEDSPAEEYGLKAGDVIIQVGRKEIEDSRDLSNAIDRYDPGEEVEVKIIRDKTEKTIKVELGESKGRFPSHFSFEPEHFDVYVPDMEITVPDVDIVIPEIDIERLEELEDRVREDIEINTDELNEELEELEEELKELKKIKIHTRHRKSVVI
jgi:membrane-associated protease RseP (regulator of RpoE activity)